MSSKNPKRPRDNSNDKGVPGGRAGGKARAEKLTSEERKEIGRKAARKRWDKSD